MVDMDGYPTISAKRQGEKSRNGGRQIRTSERFI